jgi:hypothetical protein
MSSLASGGYHYFCTNGASSCYASYFGYIIRYNDSTYIYHIPFTYGNYQSFDDIIADLASNKTDSSAKSAIDTWFTNNLANKEGDLEDTPFCNDRTITKGLLSSEESVVTTSGDGQYMYHGPYTRNSVKNASNNYEPSLDCRKVDAFTVEESDIGNGKLSHKVGLVTVDELTLSGAVSSDAYLASSTQYWTMSPRSGASAYGFSTSMYTVWSSGITSSQTASSTTGYRPVVSLKAGAEVVKGDGTKANPYILKP